MNKNRVRLIYNAPNKNPMCNANRQGKQPSVGRSMKSIGIEGGNLKKGISQRAVDSRKDSKILFLNTYISVYIYIYIYI